MVQTVSEESAGANDDAKEHISAVKRKLAGVLSDEHKDSIQQIIVNHSVMAIRISSLALLLVLAKVNENLHLHVF